MCADYLEIGKITGDAVEVDRAHVRWALLLTHDRPVTKRGFELVAFGIERIHFGIMQRDIEAIDVDVDTFEAVFFDRAVDFLQRLLDAKGVVTGEADDRSG